MDTTLSLGVSFYRYVMPLKSSLATLGYFMEAGKLDDGPKSEKKNSNGMLKCIGGGDATDTYDACDGVQVICCVSEMGRPFDSLSVSKVN